MEYYDVEKGRRIELPADSCPWERWRSDGRAAGAACGWHPDGFPVFLTAPEMDALDEYRDEDPYSVQENMGSAFQRRRLACTLDLLEGLGQGADRRLLDLGCGQGHFTSRIRSEHPQCRIAGLDCSVSAIRSAVGQYPGIDFAVADAYRPPYPDTHFDAVVCNNLWEHVPDPLALLRAVHRVLKPGGLLVVSTPSRYRLANLLRAAAGKKTALMSKLHVTEYTVGQVKDQLAYGGFDVKRVHSRPIPEARLVFRLAKPLVGLFLKAVGSHHVLEATVFYAAVKRP